MKYQTLANGFYGHVKKGSIVTIQEEYPGGCKFVVTENGMTDIVLGNELKGVRDDNHTS
jgi:hypothetical protein